MVDELYARRIISKLEVTIVIPDVHIRNIWNIPNPVEETHKDKR